VLRSGECDRQSLVVRVVLAGLAQRVLLESLAERVAQAPKAEPVLMAVLAESVVLDCLAQELLLRVVVVLPEEPMRHPKLLGCRWLTTATSLLLACLLLLSQHGHKRLD
jgi:hypothetical protein